MARGRQTRTLRKDQIERLEAFRRTAHDGSPAGYSYPQLRLAMGKPCGWETLQKALRGAAVWDLVHHRLAEWIERYLPAAELPPDGKAAAAGDLTGKRDEPNEETSGTTGTVRGPR
jgi:hypothetical protein